MKSDHLKLAYVQESRIPDTLVIERILRGEKELYEILVRRYNQRLYRILRSYLKEEDVEDAMQDTYIKAYEKLSQFQGNAAFSTWLIRIGINNALQEIRKSKQHYLVAMNEENTTTAKIIQMPDRNTMNPEKNTISRETGKLLEKAIDHLPETYRAIYMLREVEGMELSEIAACLEISESNVKVRLHRAKNMLKETLLQLSSDSRIFEFGDSRCHSMVNKVMQYL